MLEQPKLSLAKHGSIVSCFGCGSADCSMCAVFDCKTEAEAIIIISKIQEYNLREFIKK